MNPVNTQSPERGDRPNQLSSMLHRLAGWIEGIGSGVGEPVDPTARFSIREWADLPTHHPAARQ